MGTNKGKIVGENEKRKKTTRRRRNFYGKPPIKTRPLLYRRKQTGRGKLRKEIIKRQIPQGLKGRETVIQKFSNLKKKRHTLTHLQGLGEIIETLRGVHQRITSGELATGGGC